MQDPSYFADKPLRFFDEVLGIEPWEGKQQEIALSVARHQQTAVKSCFTAGKTFIAAGIFWWFLTTRRPSIVVTTATTFRQVKNLLWREIARLHNRSKWPLGAEVLQTEVKLDGEKWYGIGFSSKDPDNFRGFHEEHVLVIMDEAEGIEPIIWDAIENAMSSPNAKLLAIGNPTDPLMPFANCFRPGSGFNTITMSAFDTPNVRAGRNIYPSLMAYDWPAKKKRTHGENSPFYQYAVLAEFPMVTEDAIIPLKYIEAALDPGDDYPDDKPLSRYKGYYNTVFPDKKRPIFTGDVIHGIDVASFGFDHAVIARRQKSEANLGGKIRILENLPYNMLTSLSGRAIRHARKDRKKLKKIIVETPGEGRGVAHDLMDEKETKPFTQEYWPNWDAKDKKFYDSVKIETLFEMKEDFENGFVEIADERFGEELAQDLSQYRYDFTKKGQYKTEDKDEMKKRIGRSPDLGDAVVAAWVQPKRRPSMEVIVADGRPRREPRGFDDYLLPSGKYSKNVRQHCDPDMWERLLREGKIDPRG